MNNINMTVTFCEEDRRRIDELVCSVNLLASVIGNAQPAEVQKKIIEEIPTLDADAINKVGAPIVAEALAPATAPIIEEPQVETPTEPVAETTEEVKPVSLAEFQKAVTLAVSKGPEVKEAVKAIINKYAKSVSAVPEGKRADIIAELASI